MRHRIPSAVLVAALSGVLGAGLAGCSGGTHAAAGRGKGGRASASAAVPTVPVTPSGPATATAAAGASAAYRTDFNGDGYDDTALSAPAPAGAGQGKRAVAVAYGGKDGFRGSRRVLITRTSPGVPRLPAADGGLGSTLAVGDLDHDGYSDLAVSLPGVGNADSGPDTALVLWGGPKGLGGPGTLIPTPVAPQRSVLYGCLAIGDFNGDGRAELATETLDYGGQYSRVWIFGGGITRKGAVGKPYGLTTPNDFPETLLPADVTGDHITDLVVFGGSQDGESGTVTTVFYRGSRAGLTGMTLIPSSNSGAIGDVNGDGYADLALGSYAGGGGGGDGGRVVIKYGSKDGPGKGRPDQVIGKKALGLPVPRVQSDAFGFSVALGDVNGDGYADLAVGSAGEVNFAQSDAGTVTLLRGSASGLTLAGRQTFDESVPGIGGTRGRGDDFGDRLAFTDTDHDGLADLLVGAAAFSPDQPSVGRHGSVWTLSGTPSGLSTIGAVRLSGADFGLPGSPPSFGVLLATGWPVG